MTTKYRTGSAPRARRQSITLEIELPVLSDEAAAAMASVLVQLYHRFEATYYAQILNHHADLALAGARSDTNTDGPGTGNEPF